MIVSLRINFLDRIERFCMCTKQFQVTYYVKLNTILDLQEKSGVSSFLETYVSDYELFLFLISSQ